MLQKFCKVWRPKRAKILHALTSSAAEILHGMASNDAEILQGLTSSAAEFLHALTSSAAEILHALTSSAAEILHALTSSAAGILHALTSSAAEILHGPQQQKFCRQWNPELKKFYVLQGQCCRNSESLLFHSQKRQIVQGSRIPTVSISFLFMLFLFFSDHSWNNNTVHADVFFSFLPYPAPYPHRPL